MYSTYFFTAVICESGDVRLVGGSNPLEGRLEVCYFNQWGTACTRSGANEQTVADVACRQLGFDGGKLKRTAGQYNIIPNV